MPNLRPPSDGLGCLSASGMAVAAVALVVLLAWTLVAGATPFSPGPLNHASSGRTLGGVSSHADLGNDCAACHTAPWSPQTMGDRCMTCHADVRSEIRSRSGLHGHLIWGTAPPTCRGCHSDHNGPNGALTTVDGRNFPHQLTGFSLAAHQLTGVGSEVTCAGCHPAGLTRFDQATCKECHARLDPRFMRQHSVTFSASCLPCHDGVDRFGANFDHSRLPFPLTGRHVQVACVSCHEHATSLQVLQSTRRDCYACHARNDHHHGAFGQDCGQCHSTGSWSNATFDHSIFPITHGNSEQQATCKTCHPRTLSSYTCFGCHRHTPANVASSHEGGSLSSLTDCIRCHPQGRQGDN